MTDRALPDEPLFTPKEAAAKLGMSVKTLMLHVREGRTGTKTRNQHRLATYNLQTFVENHAPDRAAGVDEAAESLQPSCAGNCISDARRPGPLRLFGPGVVQTARRRQEGAGPATFMSLLPQEQVPKLMVLVRMAAGEHPPEEQKEALEKFCAEAIAEYLANPLTKPPTA
jgi:hypothetical protein